MKKEKYERTELDITMFESEDVIITSAIVYEPQELPFMLNR